MTDQLRSRISPGTMKEPYVVKLLILLILTLAFSFPNVYGQTKAFPSAVGAGAYVTGGRGGQVIKVTNLNDSGPGSLRDALKKPFPRIIVFEVSGTIKLNSLVELCEENSNFTVAGHTAPEGGITISGKPISMGGGWSECNEPCNNAIWRYVRFRNASYTGVPDQYEHNGVIISGGRDIIIDHCSFSFNDDQAISMKASWGEITNITVQRCLFSENATGIIAGSGLSNTTGDMSFYYNLYVNQPQRTPNASGVLQYDIVNNVMFNVANRLTNVNTASSDVNYIGNHITEGNHSTPGSVNKVQSVQPSIYTANNYHNSIYPNPQPNDQLLWKDFFSGAPVNSAYFTATMHPLLGFGPALLTAEQTRENVLSDVGTNKYLNYDGTSSTFIDSYDSTRIDDALNFISRDPFNKNWILPNLPTNSKTGYDTLNDGIPDIWKIAKGFLPDTDLSSYEWPSGYIGIEEYLNEIDGGEPATSQVYAGEDVAICEGESVILAASGAESYLWLGLNETTASVTVTPTETTTYTVEGTDADGNVSTDQVTVFLNPLPNAGAGDDQTICTGESTTLTASGGGEYLWNTGQTGASITVGPGETTTYTVTVTEGNCSSTDEVTVFVNPLPTAYAGEDVNIVLGETIILTALGGDTYLWDTGETSQSIQVSPATTTEYGVTVFSNGCSDTDEVMVFVEGQVNADAGEDVTICQGDSATLTATGGDSYMWNTGETTASIQVSPESDTEYSVTVYSGTNSGTDSVFVFVNQLPQANAGEDVAICAGESITLTANGGTDFLWSTGQTSSSIVVSPMITTTYEVTVMENGCQSSDQVTVSVNASPEANAGEDVAICAGESVTLTASGGTGFLWSTGQTSSSIIVSPGDTTTYEVTVMENGCQSSDQVTVTVNALPQANAGDDVAICAGESVTLTASGGTEFIWSTGQTSSSIVVSPMISTTYEVTVMENGCQSSDQVTVTVNTLPDANAGDDVTIDEGDSVTLTATGGQTFLWSTGETTASINVSPAVTSTYTVTVFDNGCQDTDQVTVTVNPLGITADAGEDTFICSGETVTLTATGGESYLWSNGATTQSIVVSPSSNTTYTVIVFSGNQSDTDSVTVYVNAPPDMQVSDDVTILQGTFVTLSASGADTYLWSNGATQPNIAVSPSASTTYSVTGYANGCSETEEITVSVLEPVQASAGSDQAICLGSEITLTASGGDSYVWSTGETTQSITVSPEEDTLYTVLVSNEVDSDAAEVMVMVQSCEDPIEEDVQDFQYQVYESSPNSGQFYVKVKGLNGPASLIIQDMQGMLVYWQDLDHNDGQRQDIPLHTNIYSQGVYTITLRELEKSTTKKVLFR